MKSSILLLTTVVLLTGCGSFKQTPAPVQVRMSPPVQGVARQDKANTLFWEAHRLAAKVEDGELSRVQAADRLNAYRLRLVGSNPVDDSTFSTYRYLVEQRDAGKMTQEESHSRMEMRLRDWQHRWPLLSRHPADPAFTNFLLRLYNMPTLEPVSP